MNLSSARTVKDAPLLYVLGEPVTRKDVAYIAKGTLFVALSLLTILLTIWQWQMAVADYRAWCNRPIVQGQREPTREELGAAHKFHGIFSSIEDKNHNWYFINKDGKTCKLFAYKERRK